MTPGVLCSAAVAGIISTMHNGQNWFLIRAEPQGNTSSVLTFAVGYAPRDGEPDKREYVRIFVEELS